MWARGVASARSYNSYGDLVSLEYDDGLTPTVQFLDSNRFGQPRTIIDGTGTSVLTYDHAGRLTSSTGQEGGLYAGLCVTNHFDRVYGRDLLQVFLTTNFYTAAYGYDTCGRLGRVASGDYSATYGYLPNSDLLQTTTCSNSTAPVLTTTRAWDYGMRLRSISNVAFTNGPSSGTTVSSHAYAYDSLNRRIQARLEDGSAWNYDYNDRDELIGAKRYWPDWTPVAGQQFEYAYDNIGNRTTSKAGGDANGGSLRQANYTNNNLNQYTTRAAQGTDKVDIMGVAYATATVTVNGNTAYRKSEYYHHPLTLTNGSGPAWQSVTNIATQGGVSETNRGNLLAPPATQALYYDADGNLTNDSVWVYLWDAENRLIQMTNLTTVTPSARKKLVFTYDFMSRRATKEVYDWSDNDYAQSPTTNVAFVYDLPAGQACTWNLLGILDSSSALRTSFLWGQDLSGTEQGAGGVGGLLQYSIYGASRTNCFVGFDGNGNLTAAVNPAGGAISALYAYSPVGEVLRITGPAARANPLRFSTKFSDDETGLVYYGYRYYSPSNGRWIGRDPSEEGAGLNLYGALLNSPLMQLDPDGRALVQFGTGAIARLITALSVFWLQSQGVGTRGPMVQWAQEIRITAERGIRAASMGAPTAAGSGGAGGVGGRPKNFYRYAGTGWALALTATSLLSTYSTVYAAANLALGERSSRDSYLYTVESGLINSARGEAAYADLDFIDAALLSTGGVGSTALVAWDTYAEGGEAFATGFTSPYD